MEALQIDSNLKTYSLSFDEPHMSFMRKGIEVVFKAGDLIIIKETSSPIPGLVLVSTPSAIRLCRYEIISGAGSIFPPLSVPREDLGMVILGQVTEHIRLSKWISFEEDLPGGEVR
ncbi:MAG TPA: hypothetical protein VNJ01_18265 [Bacteriovoracaceae bacterium]|nr:hypothetical protein [Bacteriovoracaceae bacterium]